MRSASRLIDEYPCVVFVSNYETPTVSVSSGRLVGETGRHERIGVGRWPPHYQTPCYNDLWFIESVHLGVCARVRVCFSILYVSLPVGTAVFVVSLRGLQLMTFHLPNYTQIQVLEILQTGDTSHLPPTSKQTDFPSWLVSDFGEIAGSNCSWKSDLCPSLTICSFSVCAERLLSGNR